MNKWVVLIINLIILGASIYFIYSNSEAMMEWGKAGKYNMNVPGWQAFYTIGLILSVLGTIHTTYKIAKTNYS